MNGALKFEALPVMPLWLLTGSRAAAADALPAMPGPNRMARNGDAEILWFGPQRWLIRSATPPDVPASAGLLVEVSDAWVGLKLHGAGALEVLGSACRMDCASMAIDCVALTSLHQVRVLLIRRGADWFELLVPRSYAEDMIESIMNPGPE